MPHAQIVRDVVATDAQKSGPLRGHNRKGTECLLFP
jgi:hypothetical protein